MSFVRDRRVLGVALVVLAILAAAYVFSGGSSVDEATLVTRVRRGSFVVSVTTSGELRARKAVNITGPTEAQQVQIYQMRISSIVPEGTVGPAALRP